MRSMPSATGATRSSTSTSPWGRDAQTEVLPPPWGRAGEGVRSAGHLRMRYGTVPARSSRLAMLRSHKALASARRLRRSMTDAEMRLWYYLRAHRFLGRSIRRQVPIGEFIVDFLCDEARIVIEVDGGQHGEREAEDLVRTRWLESQGYRVIRFWNHEVLGNTRGVLESLAATMANPLPDPPPRGREEERSPRCQGGGRKSEALAAKGEGGRAKPSLPRGRT